MTFEPPADLCERLREHTRSWPMWTVWDAPGATEDPWGDLLLASGRRRQRADGAAQGQVPAPG